MEIAHAVALRNSFWGDDIRQLVWCVLAVGWLVEQHMNR